MSHKFSRITRIVSLIALIAIVEILSGCGGGGGGSVSAPAPSRPGYGKMSAELRFKKRVMNKTADQVDGKIKIDVTVSGYYQEDDSEFPDVKASTEIPVSGGKGSLSLVSVPIGQNHVMTAVATWPDGATDTIKCIIPVVLENTTAAAVADPRTTAITNAMQEKAKRDKKKLSKVTPEEIGQTTAVVDAFIMAGYDPSSIKISDVLDYDAMGNVVSSIDISPASSTILLDTTAQFAAIPKNIYGIPVLAPLTWSVTGDIGSISDMGLFTAATVGQGTVVVAAGTISQSVLVTVNALAACGNEILETGETCDDGNTITETCAYGQQTCVICNSTCAEEPGAVSGFCGDGTTQSGSGETCDEGANNGQPNHCNDTCSGTAPATCGNGVTESGETCDDGNTATEACAYGDTSCSVCGSSCQTISGAVSYCGDSVSDAANGETCDDGNTTTEGCPYGQLSCSVCNASCQISAGTATAYCGDGTIQSAAGETCDDGESNGDPNMCNTTCNGTTAAVCGNNIIESGEACDDGNAVTEACAYGQTSCSVCSSTCQQSAGMATGYCGDGVANTANGETCDDGNNVTESCAYGDTSCSVCNSACISEAGAVTGYCGDGTPQTGNGETCDEGAANGQSNHCNTTCNGTTAAVCGNNIIESGEACDDGNAVTEACAYGQTSCSVCSSTCQQSAGMATGYCGDGVANTANGETCDDGNNVTESCAYGDTSCSVCNSACISEAGAVTGYCGDGTPQTGNGETCDEGAANGQSNHCNDSCNGMVPANCGNNIIEGGEACDDGNTVTETCAYGQTSCLVCNGSCQTMAGGTSYCGDGVSDTISGETCDDGNTTTETCAYGYISCTVCNSTCQSAAGAVTGYCGDGTVQSGSGETCDAGGSNGQPNNCNTTCNGTTPSVCGNNITEAGEACDDGNTTTESCSYGQVSCSICSSSCQIGAGMVTGFCGDGVTNSAAGETCDDGNTTTEACAYGDTSCSVCNASCQSAGGAVTGYCGDGTTQAGDGEACDDGGSNGQPNNCNTTCNGTTPSVCGNNVTESGETCDDGNTATETCLYGDISCSVCNLTCQSASGATSYCGDGVSDSMNGETCDDGNTTTESCAYGDPSCTVCNATCQSEPGAVTGYCGDGATQSGNGETCDDGGSNGQPNMCNSTCNGATPSVCGNNVSESGETCDDGNTVTEVCLYGDISCSVCDSTCQSAAGATSYCGDNVSDTINGETCDDGNTTTETCAYGQTSCTVCNATCQSAAGALIGYCGDGTVQAGDGEACDDSNTVTETCAYGQTSCTVCNTTCQSAAGTVTGYCGDSVVQSGNGETCDAGGSNGTPGNCNSACNGTVVILDQPGKLSLGNDFTCVVTPAGGAKCWGRNDFGQLGDGTFTNRTTSVDVVGLTSGVDKIASGNYSTCAVLTSGALKCWGQNGYGQVGSGAAGSNINVPTGVSGLSSGVVDVSVGAYHACALLNTGGVKCWGYNLYGSLGNGNGTDSATPVNVSGLASGVTAITSRGWMNCALMSDGTIKCWGEGGAGQLGNGSNGGNSSVPVNVVGITGAIAVTGGYNHACALLNTGGLKCWGGNGNGQLGDNSTTMRLSPVDVTGLTSGVLSVSATQQTTCALMDNGAAKCWGANGGGGIGDGTITNRPVPTTVTGITSGATSLVAGGVHTCARQSGQLKCWGNNTMGEVGDGTTTQRLTPVNINLAPTASISQDTNSGPAPLTVNFTGTCSDADGTCSSYSWNFGDGTPTNSTLSPSHVFSTPGSYSVSFTVTDNNGAPQQVTQTITVTAPSPCGNGVIDLGEFCDDGNTANGDGCSQYCYVELHAGRANSCVVNRNYVGGVECWGSGTNGELGNGTVNRFFAEPVTGLTSGVRQLSVGDYYTCVVTTAGGAKCWGRNNTGNLGDGTGSNRSVATDVTGLTTGVKMISAGQNATCAVMGAGGVKCWGGGTNGELGNGTFSSSSTPVDVTGITTAVTVQMGANYACALLSSGGVKCWGYNANGYLGDGTLTNASTPVDVIGLASGVAAIYTSSGSVTCALMNTGGAKCWGYNTAGSVGNGTFTNPQTTPVDVSGLTTGVSGLGVGYDAPCALVSGGIQCWGSNDYGQVGDGTLVNKNIPVAVSGLTAGFSAPPSCGVRVCSARKSNGDMYFWGSNLYGTFGNGTTTDSTTPVLVTP